MRPWIVLTCLLLTLPASASAQQRQPFRHFGEIYIRAARLVTLAPLCGLRDEDWARRLARGVSATRRDVLPEGQREGLASAAFAVSAGSRLFETYGWAACRQADDIMRWTDADELARADAATEPPLPRLPEAVPPLGWQAFIATMATRCDLRDPRWGRDARAGLRRAIALEPGLAEDQDIRRDMAHHIVQTAESMANLVHGTPGTQPCGALTRNAALEQADAAATAWRRRCTARRPDPSCRLGQGS